MKHYLLSHKIILIVALALIVRAAIFIAFPQVFAFDSSGELHGSIAYDNYAQNLLQTGVYGRLPGVPDSYLPPVFSYVLAALYGAFGHIALPVAVFHILLDCLSIAMLYAIGRQLFPANEWVGLLAALFHALYPYLIFQSLTVVDTALFIALFYAFILIMLLLRARLKLDRGTWLLAGLGGVIFGLNLYTRSIILPFAALAALWFLFRLSLWQTIARLLPVWVIGLALLIPWTIRNYAIYGIFMPFTPNTGENFYAGNNRYVIPYLQAGYDAQWVPPPDPPIQAADVRGPEASAERMDRAMTFLRQNPDKIPQLIWTKFLFYWSIDVAPRNNPRPGEQLGLDENGDFIIRHDAGTTDLRLGEKDPVILYSTPLFDQIGRFVHTLYWGGLFLVGLLGIGLTIRQWRDVSLLWFVQISMTAVYIFFHPSTRYRAPTDPLWFLFSAYAIVWVWAWWRARRSQTQNSSPLGQLAAEK
ncbi:MAG: glycosyltransferase family 39 protein [Chloroflexota bacterium]